VLTTMKNFLYGKIKGGFNRLGLQLSRIEHEVRGWVGEKPNSSPCRIAIGGGADGKAEHIHCDRRPAPGVQLVCQPWEIPLFATDVDAIEARHTLEYLTDEEARVTLDHWFKALRVNGTVEIVVPNVDFYIHEWQHANWNEESAPEENSSARNAFAGIYGRQHGSDPKKPDYNQAYRDVRKSGYNASRIAHLLQAAGFARIETEVMDERQLVARACKITQKKERQVAAKLEDVRADHRARYALATRYVPNNSAIADVACGIGYGSFMLAQSDDTATIFAMDIDAGAIEYAHTYYKHSKIAYHEGDITHASLTPNSFDMIVSFETIEHIQDYKGLLAIFFDVLKPGGLLLCSSPNEEVIPLEAMNNPYHFRHFTPAEFEECFQEAGFEVLERYTQTDRESDQMETGWHGIYNTAVCRKPSA